MLQDEGSRRVLCRPRWALGPGNHVGRGCVEHQACFRFWHICCVTSEKLLTFPNSSIVICKRRTLLYLVQRAVGRAVLRCWLQRHRACLLAGLGGWQGGQDLVKGLGRSALGHSGAGRASAEAQGRGWGGTGQMEDWSCLQDLPPWAAAPARAATSSLHSSQ